MREMWVSRFSNGMLAALFLAVACVPMPLLAAATNAPQAVHVTVRMTEYMFVPNHLTFRRGLLYDLHLVNDGQEIHEFTAPEFIAAIDLKNPDALGPYTNQFSVEPGATKDVNFIPRKAGRYPLICADHDWAGMTGTIVITP